MKLKTQYHIKLSVFLFAQFYHFFDHNSLSLETNKSLKWETLNFFKTKR